MKGLRGRDLSYADGFLIFALIAFMLSWGILELKISRLKRSDPDAYQQYARCVDAGGNAQRCLELAVSK